jgi:hypothetical protein
VLQARVPTRTRSSFPRAKEEALPPGYRVVLEFPSDVKGFYGGPLGREVPLQAGPGPAPPRGFY